MNSLLIAMSRLLAPTSQVVQKGDGGGSSTTTNSANSLPTDAKSITSMADFAGTLQLLLRRILGPVLAIIGVFATVYAVYLGVQYAKAEDASKRKELQGRMIGAIIGAVIIIAVATICLAINWSDVYFSFQDKHTFADKNGDNWCDYCGHNSGYKFHG